MRSKKGFRWMTIILINVRLHCMKEDLNNESCTVYVANGRQDWDREEDLQG